MTIALLFRSREQCDGRDARSSRQPGVVRTIAVATPTFSYSAADQTVDFGAPQPAINLRIFQMSSRVGRGLPLEVTL